MTTLSQRSGRPIAAFFRLMPGAVFGAGLASVAEAAEPATYGPTAIVVFGAHIPVWSLIFGVAGVLLARRVAPASVAGRALGARGNAALTLLLLLGVVALIVAGEKRPIVALGWAIGLGYSGLGAIELIARAVIAMAKSTLDGFAEVATRAAKAWSDRGPGRPEGE